jgi:alpha-galactosidase
MTRSHTSLPRRSLSAVLSLLMSLSLGVVALGSAQAPAVALDDGLARTPPMGFNNWNATHCGSDFGEAMVKATADFFVSSGLKEAGYEYVNLDDCWALPQRDADGNLVPDPARFPDGIKALADYVHARGLKIGIYTSAGTKTCNTNGFPGGLGHEYQDAAQFASWGIDYLKYDNCNNQGVDAVQRYTTMRDALKATGRPIVFSICEWGQNDPWTWASDVGHLWRTTGDISDNFASMVNILRQNAGLADYAGPGHWNDPDMLEVGNGGMTDTEYRSHFSLWAVMAAPLLIGTDLRDATLSTLDILENRDVIAVDQDRLGVQGRLLSSAGGLWVFAKPLADGDVAVALFNQNSHAAPVTTTADAAGLPAADTYLLRDLWTHGTVESAGTIGATVPAHGTVMYRVTAGGNPSAYPPNVSMSLSGLPGRVTHAQEATATVSFTDDGVLPAQGVSLDLAVPSGWSATPTSTTTFGSVESGQTVSATFRVVVPEPSRSETVSLRGTARYRWRGTSLATASVTQDVATQVLPPGVVYAGEAEAGWNTFSGAARAGGCPACSGGQKVRFIGNGSNNYLTFTDVDVDQAGDYQLVIDYTVVGSRSFWVSVNGAPGTEVPLTGTSWDQPASSSTTVHLQAGTNSVRFYNNSAYAPDLDRISVAE